MGKVTLAFLRHAKVPSHEGDMPLTEDSGKDIEAAIIRLRKLSEGASTFRFLATQTHRSRQTAEALREALDPKAPEVLPAWGLRNPDIHLAGSRVEMGSKAEFFASQCEFLELTPDVVMLHPFYRGFLTAKDRIEYWLHHQTPPGEDASAVAHRVLKFAESFRAAELKGDLFVVCVTHSPVMRAILEQGLGIPDPGEPDWVEEIVLELTDEETLYRFRQHNGKLAA
ncbi:MAG: histidine phosphatase family protein [Pseudomonadota bacterium]